MIAVDIVLPCYNPNDQWHLELLQFHRFASSSYQFNYILVNDGSSKAHVSAQVDELQKNGIRVDYISYSQNKGKGFALRRGVSLAMNDYVIYTDIDFPFNDQSTLGLVDELVKGGHDVVAGFRNDNYYQKKMSGFRRLLSKAFRNFLRNFLQMNVTDTQCGLKGFNKKGREKFLKTTINRYLFDFEFIYHSCRDENVSVHSYPVQLKDNVVFRRMKLLILLQESVNLLKVLLFARR